MTELMADEIVWRTGWLTGQSRGSAPMIGVGGDSVGLPMRTSGRVFFGLACGGLGEVQLMRKSSTVTQIQR